MTDRSRGTRWVVGGVGLVVLLLVGGPFVYFRVIQGDAPAPLGLSSPSATAPAASAGSGTKATGSNGTWNVAPGSVVGYRVKEVLFGQSHEAVGRTDQVTDRSRWTAPR